MVRPIHLIIMDKPWSVDFDVALGSLPYEEMIRDTILENVYLSRFFWLLPHLGRQEVCGHCSADVMPRKTDEAKVHGLTSRFSFDQKLP